MKFTISMMQFLFIGMMLFVFQSVHAQIEVHSFRALPMDQTARITDPVIDQNGYKSALIKVVTTETGFSWDAGLLGITEVVQKVGEIWVYVPKGSRKITIKHERHGVLRNYFYPDAIQEAGVYEMVLKTKIIIPDGKGDLNLLSKPDGATIKIDGFPAFNEKTPYEFRDYKAQPHRMIISRERYEPVDTTLIIYKDSLVEHTISLKPRFGGLTLDVEPDDASVFLENENLGTGDITLTGEGRGPDAGKYSLEVKKDRYYPYFEIIEIEAGKTTEIDIGLKPRLGSLSVNTKPENAELLLDGTSMGYTPVRIDELIVGEHRLIIKKQGYQTINTTIQITEGETFNKEYFLNSKKMVKIRTKPGNADITINNKDYGDSPLEAVLPLGENRIIIRKEHHQTIDTFFTVKEEQDKYFFSLELIRQKLHVITKPSKAEVLVDGDSIGYSPATTKLVKGKHKIKVSKSGYISTRRTVFMRYSDKTKKIRMRSEGMINMGYLNGPHWNGFDLGFVFNRVLFGINFNGFSTHKPDLSLAAENVSSADIPGIVFNEAEDFIIKKVKDGESETAGFAYKIEFGYRMLRPFHLIFTAGYGHGSISSIEYIYRADRDYYDHSDDLVISEGEYYSEPARKKEFSSFVTGLKIQIATSSNYGIYLNGNYWFNTPFERNYTIGGGIVFSNL